MIVSFADKDTERLAEGKRVLRFTSFERIALRKIRQLQIAASLNDLSIPPGNRLEALVGDRKDSTAFESTIGIGSASHGQPQVQKKLRLSTTTRSA